MPRSPNSRPEEPRAKQRTDNRQRILDVATVEFSQKGFAGARVDEIARMAKVNKQLIYYYFESKRGLYNVVEHGLVDRYHAFYADRPAADRLRDRLLRYTRMAEFADRTRWRRMWMWEALEGSVEVVRQEERRTGWKESVEEIRLAQASGELDSRLDPELTTLAFESIIHTPQMLPQITELVTGLKPDDPAFVARREKFLSDLFDLLRPRD